MRREEDGEGKGEDKKRDKGEEGGREEGKTGSARENVRPRVHKVASPALTTLFHGQERDLATQPSLWLVQL